MKQAFQTCRIADIAEKVAMGPFGSNIKVETFVPAGVPIISGAHLKGFYLEGNDFNFITEEHAQRLKNSIVYPGDIIFTHAGNVGQAAMIPYNCHYPFYMISQRQFYLRCNKEKVLPEYLTYYFHSYEGQGKLLSNVSQVGVPSIAQPSSFLKTIEVSLPSLDVQRRIVNILDSFTKKIEVNNRVNRNLEEQAKAIFKSWFVDFEPFQDGEFVDSELGRIPKGWKVGKFTDVIHILGGGTPKTSIPEYWNGAIPFFTPKDVGNSVYTFTTEKYLTEEGLNNCNSHLYLENTVFVTARGTVGKLALAGVPMAMNQSCYALTGKENVPSLYVFCLALQVVETLKKIANGAVFDAIVTRDFEMKNVINPPEEVINRFVETITPLFKMIHSNGTQNTSLVQSRDILLPKLMSGEINVFKEIVNV